MRLVIPETEIGTDLQISPTRPLPVDLVAWQRRVLVTGAAGQVEVRSTEETETNSGWPVVLVRSEVLDGDRIVIASRLHGFYRLIDRGCVIAATGTDAAEVEASRGALLAADVDWRSDELVALTQLWETGP